MLSDLRGKVVMLQFTASWCKVCHKEMPHIEREIWQKHKKTTAVLLCSALIIKVGGSYCRFCENYRRNLSDSYGQKRLYFGMYARPDAGITRNVVIDSTGKIVFLTRLFSQSEFDEMCRMIDQLLTDFSN